MHLEQLKKNIGWWVTLEPTAIRLDENGDELPMKEYEWVVREVSETVTIANEVTGHFYPLGPDHIHHFTSNPAASAQGVKRGVLILTVQLFLQGNRVFFRSTDRPGSRASLDGRSGEERAARAKMMDERLERVMKDYSLRGTPAPMIDTFADLSLREKAALFDRAITLNWCTTEVLGAFPLQKTAFDRGTAAPPRRRRSTPHT